MMSGKEKGGEKRELNKEKEKEKRERNRYKHVKVEQKWNKR
jgi:hypothetical protein